MAALVSNRPTYGGAGDAEVERLTRERDAAAVQLVGAAAAADEAYAREDNRQRRGRSTTPERTEGDDRGGKSPRKGADVGMEGGED